MELSSGCVGGQQQQLTGAENWLSAEKMREREKFVVVAKFNANWDQTKKERKNAGETTSAAGPCS